MNKQMLSQNLYDQIHAQIEIWRKEALTKKEERVEPVLPFLTISRQYGCRAYALAEAIATRLNENRANPEFVVYDKRILETISTEEKMSSHLIESLTRKTRNELEDILVGLFAGNPSEMKAFNHLSRVVCAIARKGHVIIIGRGGALITREMQGGIHIRMIASKAWRMENLKNFPERVSDANLEALDKNDEEREGFVKKYLGADISNPKHYHLIINNEKLSIASQANAVISLLDNKR